jgi:hypothetical protein
MHDGEHPVGKQNQQGVHRVMASGFLVKYSLLSNDSMIDFE